MAPQSAQAPTATFVAHEVRRTGGMERAQREIISGLLEGGWNIRLLTRVCDLPAHERLTVLRVRTPRSPFVLAYPLFALVAGVLLLRVRRGPIVALGAIVPNRVDIVTLQFCHHGLRAAEGSGRGTRRGWLANINGQVATYLALAAERWCYRPDRTRAFVAVSSSLQEELSVAFPRIAAEVPIEVVPNGVSVDEFLPDADARRSVRKQFGIDADANLALFVGGDWERKGLGIASEAAARAGWKLLVVGNGDPASYQADHVLFAGPVNDVPRYFAAADAFVLPSRYEGFALVALEAAASGLPLLLTGACGAGELVGSGDSGWVLPRDAEAFAGALSELAERGPAMALAAREAARKFDWCGIASSYDHLLRDRSLATRGRSGRV